jgi:signal transduction histidine kinase
MTPMRDHDDPATGVPDVTGSRAVTSLAEGAPPRDERWRRDQQGWRALTEPRFRIGIILLAVVALAYQELGVDRSWRVSVLSTVFIALSVGITWLARRRPDHTVEIHRFSPLLFRLAVTGIAFGMPTLVRLVPELDLLLYAPLAATMVVAVLFTGPWRHRAILAGVVIVGWGVGLWLDGLRDPVTWLLQIGGLGLVYAATIRLAGTLSDNALVADRLRTTAELRARLLTSMLRTNTLRPDEVLRAAVDGLLEAGFDAASIRRLDHEREVAVLVEGVARYEVDLVIELPFEGSVVPDVVAGRERLLIQDAAADPRTYNADHPYTSAVFLPLFDGDRVDAIVGALHRTRALTPDELTAAQLLAEQADRALGRARAYEADERTVAELRVVDRRIQDFVSTLSHELRTPLTVIHGLGQTLTSRWDELEARRRGDLLRRIDANAERLSTMMRSLLDTSAVESGELTVRTDEVSLRELIGSVVHRSASVTSVHPVRVDIPAGLRVVVDPALFAHVIENLLANVEKHTPDGTAVTIAAVMQPTDVSADGRPVQRVRVSVSDTGPGIADEDLPHVLDRFYRGGHPDTRATSGLGLGLALAQDIVEAHDGVLLVHSEPGTGTTFSFDVEAVPQDR